MRKTQYPNNVASLKAADQRGVTLVELIIAIVVIGIAVTAVFFGLANMVGHSADSMVQTQSLMIAKSYLEEVSSRPFTDPDTGDICDTITPDASDRPLYDNICDYLGLAGDTVVRDQNGNEITDLSGYAVSVGIDVNAGSELNGISAADAIKITVTVSSGEQSTTLIAYRSRY